MKYTLKPLDFVLTPKGNIALVVETHEYKSGVEASLAFINPDHDNEYNAWWSEKQLTVINSLPYLLASEMRHPFGNGQESVDKYFKTNGISK